MFYSWVTGLGCIFDLKCVPESKLFRYPFVQNQPRSMINFGQVPFNSYPMTTKKSFDEEMESSVVHGDQEDEG